MSIRPQFAAAILDGSTAGGVPQEAPRRRHRHRRRLRDGSRYVRCRGRVRRRRAGRRNTGGVCGPASPRWPGIDREGFFNYYDGSVRAVGIVIGSVDRYDQSRPLGDVDPGARPPQSFKYLPA